MGGMKGYLQALITRLSQKKSIWLSENKNYVKDTALLVVETEKFAISAENANEEK